MKIGIVTVLLCACGGSVTSSSGPAGDGGPSSDSATDGPPGPLSAVCDGVPGLTGQAVVDAVARLAPLRGTLEPYIYPPGPPQTGSPVAVTLRAHYEGGTVQCNPAMAAPPGTPNPGTTPASVTVTVQVDFATADGMFAESFPASFSGDGSTLQFTGVVPAVVGTFKDIADKGSPVSIFGTLSVGYANGSNGGVMNGRPFAYYSFK